MDYTIREIQKQEYPLLDNFLYEAIFIPEDIEPPPKSIISSPELQIYVKHFGESKDDWGLVAEVGADIYLRIHANGSENPNDSGALTMVPSANNPYIAQLHNKSYALGEAVINAYCQSCGLTNRGVMFSDNMAGTNWSQVPVTVLEMGFMTNQSGTAAQRRPQR